MGWLDGKVALVTGGGSGLGRAVVKRYLAEGARVAVFDLSQDRLDDLKREARDIATVQGDVTSLADNVRAVSAAVDAFGRLDIFVGNAGVYDKRISLRDIPAEKLSASFDELFGVDVKGYLLGAKACLPELDKTGGCIIFTASVSGFAPGYGGVLYVPAKHAVVGLTRQLAFELAPTIRVNAVGPGGVATQLAGLKALNQERSPTSAAASSMLRPPDEYTGLYVLLASGENSGVVSGTVIDAGGASTRGPRPVGASQ